MKVQVLFLMVALGCGLVGGKIVSKCDLRRQLMNAITMQSEETKQAGLTQEDFVAKMVCHAEMASNFSTDAVKELICGAGDHHSRRKRAFPYDGLLNLAKEDNDLSTARSHTQARGPLRRPPSLPRPSPCTRPSPHIHLPFNCQEEEVVSTLYGIFQLGSHLTCTDGETPSPNICDIDCTNLLDDSIQDDIHCLLTVFRNLVENGFGAPHWEKLRASIRLILQEECRDKKAWLYFAEC